MCASSSRPRNSEMPTTIVLADDHPIVRQGLRALLDAEPAFRIVGEATDGPETIALVERLKPTILILDVLMPGLSGMEITRRVANISPHTRVIILSIHAEAHVLEALKNGAAGYALKDVELADLIRGLHEVAAGRRYLSPPLSERAIEAYAKRAAAGEDMHDAHPARARDPATRRRRPHQCGHCRALGHQSANCGSAPGQPAAQTGPAHANRCDPVCAPSRSPPAGPVRRMALSGRDDGSLCVTISQFVQPYRAHCELGKLICPGSDVQTSAWDGLVNRRRELARRALLSGLDRAATSIETNCALTEARCLV